MPFISAPADRAAPRFIADIAKPFGPLFILDPGFCDQYRYSILLVEFDEDLPKWLVTMMTRRYLSAARIIPLIVEIVVEAHDVDHVRSPAELSCTFAQEHVKSVELRSVDNSLRRVSRIRYDGRKRRGSQAR